MYHTLCTLGKFMMFYMRFRKRYNAEFASNHCLHGCKQSSSYTCDGKFCEFQPRRARFLQLSFGLIPELHLRPLNYCM